MRIAWFTPYSTHSAIAQCSASVLGALVHRAEVVVFASDIDRGADAISHQFEVRLLAALDPVEAAALTREFDIAVYNLGDHFPMHRRSFDVSRAVPGIVVLHDLVMHHFFSGKYLTQDPPDREGYAAELEYAHGPSGRRMAEAMLAGDEGPLVWEGPRMLEYHMAASATRGALGIVVHSEFARRELEQVAGAPVRHIDFPAPLRTVSPETHRGPDSEPLALVTFGVVNRNKLIHEVIRAIGESEVLRHAVTYDVIGDLSGSGQYADELRAAIADLGLSATVRLHGRQPDETLLEHVANAAVIINLRNPHYGESSWSLLESASAGKATVVWGHGSYDEVPEDVVVKIRSVAELRPALERLVTDRAMRDSLGSRASAYARTVFSSARYADEVLEFAEAARYNAPVLRLADFASAALVQLRTSDPELLRRVSAEIVSLAGVQHP
jgi:glycosyltransferase involved in cell wall biosynthesis